MLNNLFEKVLSNCNCLGINDFFYVFFFVGKWDVINFCFRYISFMKYSNFVRFYVG